MENNIQVQKAADISSLDGVVIVSLSALTAYNIGEKFNHNILFDATIFIISLVMLILTFAIFRKVMAGLFTTISSSTTNKQVQSECSQESNHQNANQDPVEEEQIPDSLERYESILVEEQLKEVKRKRDIMIAIREYVVEKTSKYLSKENISTLFQNIECIAENRVNDCQPIHSTKEAKISSPSLSSPTSCIRISNRIKPSSLTCPPKLQRPVCPASWIDLNRKMLTFIEECVKAIWKSQRENPSAASSLMLRERRKKSPHECSRRLRHGFSPVSVA